MEVPSSDSSGDPYDDSGIAAGAITCCLLWWWTHFACIYTIYDYIYILYIYIFVCVQHQDTRRDQGELSPLRSGNPGFVIIWLTFAISGLGDSLTLSILFPDNKYDLESGLKHTVGGMVCSRAWSICRGTGEEDVIVFDHVWLGCKLWRVHKVENYSYLGDCFKHSI